MSTPQKPSPRSSQEVAADVRAERSRLEESLAELERGIGEAAEEARGDADRVAAKARRAAPVAAGVALSLLVARTALALRRRRRRRRD